MFNEMTVGASSHDPQTVTLLIEPEWIIPIAPSEAILTGHSIAVNDGTIVGVMPSNEANQRFHAKETVVLPGQVVLPGFVNLHTHAAMNLLRGFADDLPLEQWLQDKIWPAESRLMSESFVRDGTLLACAEMLRSGITCFNDMYFYPRAIAAAASQAGMRASIGLVVIEFPTVYGSNADDYLTNGMAARDQLKGNPLLSFNLAPHAPYTVTDQSFQRIGVLADQLELGIHIHLHETLAELSASEQRYGVRPLARLHALGLVGPQFLAIHAVHMTDGELELLADQGAHIAHCPTSNLKLGSGIAPMAKVESRGINFGFGTDGAASNNRLDILAELRLASLLAKGASGNATTLKAHAALYAATLGGAKALGLDQHIGSIEVGKSADLCAIRLDDWLVKPCFDVASHVSNVCGREHVTNVWVAGTAKVSDGELLSVPAIYLAELAEMWQNRAMNP